MKHSLIDPTKDIKTQVNKCALQFVNKSWECKQQQCLQITLLWEDVNVSVKIKPNPIRSLAGRCHKQELTTSEKPILRGVNGTIKPGQLMAILGSSGAGKLLVCLFIYLFVCLLICLP